VQYRKYGTGYAEWFPATDYHQEEGPQFEVYLVSDISAYNYKCEVCEHSDDCPKRNFIVGLGASFPTKISMFNFS